MPNSVSGTLHRHMLGFPCFVSLNHLSRLMSWNRSCPRLMQEETEANLLSVTVDNTLSHIRGTVLNMSRVLLGGRYFPGSSASKQSACSAGDPRSSPRLGRSAGEGIGYPLQYSWAPCGSVGKESTCNVGDLGSIPGLGRSPGEGKG